MELFDTFQTTSKTNTAPINSEFSFFSKMWRKIFPANQRIERKIKICQENCVEFKAIYRSYSIKRRYLLNLS